MSKKPVHGGPPHTSWEGLFGTKMPDVRNPEHVSVTYESGTLWVNVNGACICRIQGITEMELSLNGATFKLVKGNK